MTFQDVLTQAIDWLQRDKRITYRALQRWSAPDLLAMMAFTGFLC